jgi:lysophospholipase L1-like esterase
MRYSRDLARRKRRSRAIPVLLTLAALVGAIALAEVVLSGLPASRIVQGGERPIGVGRDLVLREYRPDTVFAFVPPATRSVGDESVPAVYPLETDRNGFINPGAVHDRPDATIVFLGGSTTEAMFVSPAERFPHAAGRLIEQRTGLRVNTLNGGRSGNNTMHANLLLVGKVLPMRPTAVVLMENVNDVGTLASFDTYWNQDSNYALVRTPRRVTESALTQVRDSLVPYTYRAIRRALRGTRQSRDRVPAQVGEAATAPAPTLDPERVEAWTRQYESSLRQFVATTRAWGAQPVLMTQVWIEAPEYADDPGFLTAERLARRGLSISTFAVVHARFNDVVRDVATDEGAVLIDLSAARRWRPADVYDGLHFTDSGSRIAAEVVAGVLAPWLALRRP